MGKQRHCFLSTFIPLLCVAFQLAPRTLGLPTGISNHSSIIRLLKIRKNEKFLWYVPHGGFGNQIISLKNALRLAGILKRTLIIPPLMGHKECEHRVCHTKLDEIRWAFWHDHANQLYSPNYVSIADVVDISTISKSLVRTIDFRLFSAVVCGIDVSRSLSLCGWCKPLIKAVRRLISHSFSDSLSQEERLLRCGVELGAYEDSMAAHYTRKLTVHKEQLTCYSHAFVYFRDESGDLLATERPSDAMEGTCPQGPTSRYDHYLVKNGNAVNKQFGRAPLTFVNVLERYGGIADVDILSVATTFFYFDLETPTGDPQADQLSCATEFLPFNPEIMRAGQKYVEKNFPEPYMCVHFRGGDGDFSDQRAQQLEMQAFEYRAMKDKVSHKFGVRSFDLFFMSDLSSSEWQVKFEEKFEANRMRFSNKVRHLEKKARVMAFSMGLGVLTNRVRAEQIEDLRVHFWDPEVEDRVMEATKHTVQSYIEQAVCTCAELGFLGHGKSTFSASIQRLRLGKVCNRSRVIS